MQKKGIYLLKLLVNLAAAATVLASDPASFRAAAIPSLSLPLSLPISLHPLALLSSLLTAFSDRFFPHYTKDLAALALDLDAVILQTRRELLLLNNYGEVKGPAPIGLS